MGWQTLKADLNYYAHFTVVYEDREYGEQMTSGVVEVPMRQYNHQLVPMYAPSAIAQRIQEEFIGGLPVTDFHYYLDSDPEPQPVSLVKDEDVLRELDVFDTELASTPATGYSDPTPKV